MALRSDIQAESQSSVKSMPVLNYLWIGKPTNDNPDAVAGHDVLGPIEVAMQLQYQEQNNIPANKVVFWCLKEHEEYYIKLFQSENVNITVKAIDDLIEQEKNTELKKEAEMMSASLHKLNNKDKMAVINFKNMCDLFLLNSQTGYILDTNVRPYPNYNKILNIKKDYPIVFDYLSKTSAIRSPDSKSRGDFYLLYSAKRKSEDALRMFHQWSENPGYGRTGILKDINILDSLEANAYFKESPYGLFKFSFKSYFHEKYNGLLYFIECSNDVFEKIIRFGNIHHPVKEVSDLSNDKIVIQSIGHTSLLDYLIIQNDIEKIKILLTHGANLDFKTKYKINNRVDHKDSEIVFTPLELAHFLVNNNLVNNNAIVELIEHHQKQMSLNALHAEKEAVKNDKIKLPFFDKTDPGQPQQNNDDKKISYSPKKTDHQ